MNAPAKPSRFRQRGLLRAIAVCAALLVAAISAAPASAEFGINEFEVTTLNGEGEPFTQAGGHPASNSTSFFMNYSGSGFNKLLEGRWKDVIADLPPGFVGDSTAIPQCTSRQLLGNGGSAECPPNSQVGRVELKYVFLGRGPKVALYNMVPDPGQAAKFAFNAFSLQQLGATVRSNDYGVTISALNSPENLPLAGTTVELWGIPADHLEEVAERNPILRMPTSCTGPIPFTLHVSEWEHPGVVATESILSHNNEEPPEPIGDTGCEGVPFTPTASAKPSSKQAASPTGLDFVVEVPSNGLKNPDGISQSDVKRVEMDLPTGMSLNDSSANGLAGCSEEQIGLGTDSKVGCPEASKVGTVKIQTPILDEELTGALYLAKQNENPFNSTVALYLLAENEERGIRIKQAGEVQLDQGTGQMKVIFDGNPQQPFSRLTVHLKTGPRAPLTTPQSCGTYQVTTKLTPWSGTATVTKTNSFEVTEGCSTGRFDPSLDAGTTNPIAGNYSPFVFDVGQQDGEANLSGIDLTLPEGLTAKLAGVALCPDAGAATGNCPIGSKVGEVNVAAGAGPSPVWVPQAGKEPTAVYLAGPYAGAPYSVIAKVPAQAGPFDLGTVSVRSRVNVNPETAQVSVVSDALPQILMGIPVNYRQVHVAVDREGFMLNPTSCEEMTVGSTMHSAAGQRSNPNSRFQVGNCANLGFAPRTHLRLFGKTRRGAHPKIRAVVRMPKARNANITSSVVVLPKSEILDQGHIRTVCTRVQYNAGVGGGTGCPAASIYGYAKVWTPLLDKPLQGPVFMRSNGGERELPDLIASLNGQIHIDLVGFIDAVHGRIRTRFDNVPDAPVSAFMLQMKGGAKGLLQNSTNTCRGTHRAVSNYRGHNGRLSRTKPIVVDACKRRKRSQANHKRRHSKSLMALQARTSARG